MYLHISPWAPHTFDFVVLTSLTHPRKIHLVVLQIGEQEKPKTYQSSYVLIKWQFDQPVWFSGKYLDLYPGSYRFESLSRHWLSWLLSSCLSSVPAGKCRCSSSIRERFLPNPFHFIVHWPIYERECLYVARSGFVLRSLFDPYDGGSKYLRNIHTTSQLTRHMQLRSHRCESSRFFNFHWTFRFASEKCKIVPVLN
jgi:hypothetical protein